MSGRGDWPRGGVFGGRAKNAPDLLADRLFRGCVAGFGRPAKTRERRPPTRLSFVLFCIYFICLCRGAGPPDTPPCPRHETVRTSDDGPKPDSAPPPFHFMRFILYCE